MVLRLSLGCAARRIALTVALSLVVAVLQTLVDTGLRMSLPPPRLRNLQALVSLVSARAEDYQWSRKS